MKNSWRLSTSTLLCVLVSAGTAWADTPSRCPTVDISDKSIKTKATTTLSVTSRPQIWTATMSRPPSSRVRLSLDRHGENIEVEWDPNTPDQLIKSVTLQPGDWQVSFWAEPVLAVQASMGQKAVQVQFNLNCFTEESGVTTAHGHFYDALGTLEDEKVQRPALTVALAAQKTGDRTQLADFLSARALDTGQMRSFLDASVPPGVQEAFEVLAEIAVERAKSRGLAVLTKKLKKRMCDDLTWDKLDDLVKVVKLGSPARSNTEVLPSTCAAVSSIRIYDLVSSGKSIMRALRDDMVQSVLPYLISKTLAQLGMIQAGQDQGADNKTLARRDRGAGSRTQALKAAAAPKDGPGEKADQDTARPAVIASMAEKLTPIMINALAGDLPTREQALTILAELAREDWIESVYSIDGVGLRTAFVMLQRLPELHSELQAAENAEGVAKATMGLLAEVALASDALDGLRQEFLRALLPVLGSNLPGTLEKLAGEETVRASVRAALTRINQLLDEMDYRARLDETLRVRLDQLLGLPGSALAELAGALTTEILDKLSVEQQARLLSRALLEVRWTEEYRSTWSNILASALTDRDQVKQALGQWALTHASKKLDAINARLADDSPTAACGLDLAFRVLVYCARNGKCSPGDIVAMVKNPDPVQHPALGIPEVCTRSNAFNQLNRVWPDIDVFVIKAKNIVAPDRSVSDDEILRASVELFFDVMIRVQCRNETQCQDSKTSYQLQTLRDTILAALDGDVSTVLVKSGMVLQEYLAAKCEEASDKDKCSDGTRKVLLRLRQATALIGAIASYAETYSVDDKSAEDQAAAREARKQAIESLIDAATERRGREGDTIVSIGSSVGVQAIGGQLRYDDAGSLSERELVAGQVSLPMGVAWQRFRGKDAKIAGLHAQLSLVDLGQFLARSDGDQADDLTWADFVMIGGQVGLIIGSPSNPLVIGLDARWSPTLFESVTDETTSTSKRGALRAGLFVSYYVPFFDLN